MAYSPSLEATGWLVRVVETACRARRMAAARWLRVLARMVAAMGITVVVEIGHQPKRAAWWPMVTRAMPASSMRAEAAPWVVRLRRVLACGRSMARRWIKNAAWTLRPPVSTKGRAAAQPRGREIPAVSMRVPEMPIKAAAISWVHFWRRGEVVGGVVVMTCG